ncbi:unnamed protein product [Notodromas monacha]|uniref:FAS1 domain-containing protein n=1 Tax=Notodromas monacha TaxID=399045 RepID=A0A7R9BDG8_9CRUS|nr:unnamed protein product [Notodromas monacha]CAG0912763.1 unnamed protein product [Notodromas monacha]
MEPFSAGTIYLNDIPLLLEETPVSHGTLYFVDNLFFVTSELVRELNEAHRDKETGPLLGSPWPESQFLSHVFMNLEDREDTTLFASYLNYSTVSDLFPTRKDGNHLSYTAFIPRDSAITNLLESARWSEFRDPFEIDADLNRKMMLNHFVPGYKYVEDLSKPEDVVLTTMAGTEVILKSVDGNLTYNGIPVLESNLFVYDLGNMYIIDGVNGINEDDVNASMTRVPLSSDSAAPVHQVIEDVLAALEAKADEFTKLRDYLASTDMSEELDESAVFPGIYTVFAPTDAAFKEIVSDALPDPFADDPVFRKKSLLNFIAPQPVNIFDLEEPEEIRTLGDQSLTVHKHGNVILLTYDQQNTITIDPLKKLVMPEGLGIVYPVDKVPFITATDVNNAIENLAVMESSALKETMADEPERAGKHPFVQGANVALKGQTDLSKMKKYWTTYSASHPLEEGEEYTLIALKDPSFKALEKEGVDPVEVDEFFRDRMFKRLIIKGNLNPEKAENGASFPTLSQGFDVVFKKFEYTWYLTFDLPAMCPSRNSTVEFADGRSTRNATCTRWGNGMGDTGVMEVNGARVDIESSGEFGNGAGRLLVVQDFPFRVSDKEVNSALSRRCSPKNEFSSNFFREVVAALKPLPQFSSVVSYIQCSTIPGDTILIILMKKREVVDSCPHSLVQLLGFTFAAATSSVLVHEGNSRLPLTFFAPSNTAIHFAIPADAIDPFVSNGAFRDVAILKHITEALTFEDLEEPLNVTSLGGHVIKFTRHSPNLLRANNVLVDQDGEIELEFGRIVPVRGLLIPLTDVDDAIGQDSTTNPFSQSQSKVEPSAESLILNDQPVAGSSQEIVQLPSESPEKANEVDLESVTGQTEGNELAHTETTLNPTTIETTVEVRSLAGGETGKTDQPTTAASLVEESREEVTTVTATTTTETRVVEAETHSFEDAKDSSTTESIVEEMAAERSLEDFPVFLNLVLRSLEDSPKNNGPAFTRLVRYMRLTDFSTALPAAQGGPYTFLAPTDSAFRRGLPADAIDVFLVDTEFRKNSLLRMMIPGKIESAGSISALNGDQLSVTESDGTVYRSNIIGVESADVYNFCSFCFHTSFHEHRKSAGKLAVNDVMLETNPIVLPENLGYIYPIGMHLTSHAEVAEAIRKAGPHSPFSHPLMKPVGPPQVSSPVPSKRPVKAEPEVARFDCEDCKNFVEILVSVLENVNISGTTFEEFSKYVLASDLTREFPETDGNGLMQPYTAFVPSDSAVFRSLFQDVANPYVSEGTESFRRKSMLHHFVKGKVEIAFLPPGSVFSSLNGFPINIQKSNDPGVFTVNQFIQADLPAITLPKGAGLIYIVDRILTPSEDMVEALSKLPAVNPFGIPVSEDLKQSVGETNVAAPPAPPSRSEEISFKILSDIQAALRKTGMHKLLIKYLDESMTSLMLEDFTPGVTFIAPVDAAFETLQPGLLDPFITNPGFRVETLRTLFIGPPPVDLRNLKGTSISVLDKSYQVDSSQGNLTLNGIAVMPTPEVLPGDEGFVFFVASVPFITSADTAEALRRPRPPPRTRQQSDALPPGVEAPAPSPQPARSESGARSSNVGSSIREAAAPTSDGNARVINRLSPKKLRRLDTDGLTFRFSDNGRFLDKIQPDAVFLVQVISRGQRIRQQGGAN